MGFDGTKKGECPCTCHSDGPGSHQEVGRVRESVSPGRECAVSDWCTDQSVNHCPGFAERGRERVFYLATFKNVNEKMTCIHSMVPTVLFWDLSYSPLCKV